MIEPVQPRRHFTIILGSRLLSFLLVAVLVTGVARGQSSSFKPGDDIQVYFLNKWMPAKVVETNRRGDVLAEFEFAGAAKRQAFRKAEVRFAFEADAITPARGWSDASGQFNIRAALVRIDEGTITLRKPDMKEVKVPIAKLSESDQSFLKKLEKDLGPAALRPPELPPVEQFNWSSAASAGVMTGSGTPQALTPDPIPAYLTIKEGGAAFSMASVFDRLGAVIPIGGGDSWLLAAVESNQPESNLGTRLLWASLAKQSISGQQLLPSGEVVLDYHPPSHRLLTHSSTQAADHKESIALTVWEVLPTDKQVKAVVRWNANPDKDPTQEPWGRLITGDLVLQRSKNHEYVAWDVPGKSLRYRLNQESFFAPLPTLTPGRKFLFMPQDKRVTVIDTQTGEVVSTLPSEDGAAGIAITEDGKRAAVLGRTTLTIWDLTDPNVQPQKLQAEAIGSPFRSRVRWVDDQHLIADTGGDQVLFSLKHQLALWSYRFDGDAVHEHQGRRIRDIVAGHLVFAASVRSGTERGLAVGAVKLPGPKVAEVAANLDPESLMIVKPGTAVQVVVRAGGDSQRVQAALEKKVAANGWTLTPGADTKITAEMRQGETQQVTYQVIGGFGGNETVTLTPFISEIKIEVGTKVAWSGGTASGVPPFLHLQQGQTVQSEVNKWQKPDPGFFDRVELPRRILDPDKRNGVGLTKVTNRGLIVE